MRYLTSRLAIALMITTIALGACQSAKKTETSPSSITPTAPSSQTASNTASTASKPVASLPTDEWVIEDQEILIPVIDELGQHLRAARLNFLEQDNKAAASEINEAAAFLERESHQVSPAGKATLDKAIAALKNIAGEVKSGKIKSVQELDPSFVQAYQADTEHLWVVLDEQSWFPIVEKSTQYWQVAKEDFLNKDYSRAAQEIRKGTAFLRLEAHHASGEIKSALLASVKEIDQLAKQVKQGQVQNVKLLDDAFAQGHLAATRFYDAKAQQAMSEDQFVKIGYDLKAAAHHLEAGATWLGQEQATDLKAALKDSRLVAEQLIEGKQPEMKQIDHAIASLDEQSQTFSEEAMAHP